MQLQTNKIKRKGLTLIEVTFTIVVLLGLITLLFLSARTYIDGTNRAKCIVNMSNIQRSAVSYINVNNIGKQFWNSLTLEDAAKMSSTVDEKCPSGNTDYLLTPTDNQDDVWVTCGSVSSHPLHVLTY